MGRKKQNVKHKFARLEWTSCEEKPDTNRRVMVWHRVRRWCRFHRGVVGWWNGKEWLRDGKENGPAVEIYQPLLWKDYVRPKAKA